MSKSRKYYATHKENETTRKTLKPTGNSVHDMRDWRHSGIYAQMIDEQREPINIENDNIMVAGDWHIPFQDVHLVEHMFGIKEEYSIDEVIIPGDFWDCDSYSRFTHLTIAKTFPEEQENVKTQLKILLREFKKIYVCRGNHEKRWIDLNAGRMTMQDLFKLSMPGNISEDDFKERVRVTQDDHVYLYSGGEYWLLCHPRNFRIINLSVARDLAAKYRCNVVVAHGHQFAQGWDRSGQYRIADGGGLFDKDSLDYHRETTCHPEVRSGFYIIQDNNLIPFEGR